MKTDQSIRVFISSTFIDNQSERDLLVKKIFPQLRKICEKRNVLWSEVDLRWGIPEEKINEGKLIPVIIEEIKRCRPYFIGILGDRYGYVPKERDFAESVLELYPWLRDYPDKSITELEIIYGVFENKEISLPAFFYLKTSDQLKSENFKEEYDGKRQEILKNKIKHGRYTWHEYSNLEQFGQLVLKDFTCYIEKEFPENEIPDNFEVESRSQLSFMKSRGSIYIGGEKYFSAIENFLNSSNRLLLADGVSGSGKTALLANWVLKNKDCQTGPIVFSHFIGATENSTNWRQMLARFIHYICLLLSLPETIPDEADALRSEFKKMLANLNSKAKKRKIVFVIDALNQLEDREGACELLWLPEMVNKNIFFITSSLPGKSVEMLSKIEHANLRIDLLTYEEMELIVQSYLNNYSKTLSGKLLKKVLSNELVGIPLFLITLLNEIRLFGKYDELESRLDYYLDSKSSLELFMKVINRLDFDFGQEINGIVQNALRFIYVSRKGISEQELLDLLSPDKKTRLPVYYWSPFYLAFENSFVNHSGLINFSHDYLKKAVWETYIQTSEEEKKIHRHAASYYLARGNPISKRIADELPWHLVSSGQFKRLFKLLLEPDIFNYMWKNNKYDLKLLYAILDKKGTYSIEKTISFKVTNFRSSPLFYYNLLSFLYEMSKWDEVRKLSKPIIRYFISVKDWESFGRLTNIIGQMMLDGEPGEVTQIMKWSKITKRKSIEMASISVYMNSLINLSYGYSDMGRNKIAIRYNNEVIKLAIENREIEALYTAYNNNAVIYNNMGKDSIAMDLYNKVLKIGYDTGDQGAVQLAKGNMAWIYYNWGELKMAGDLFMENERSYREWGDNEGYAYAKYCIAMIKYENDELDIAEALFNEAINIYRSIKDYAWIPAVMGWLGLIASEKKLQEKAIGYFEKGLELYKKVPDYAYLPSFMADYSKVLINMGNFRRANNLLRKAEEMSKRVDYKAIFIDVLISKVWYYLQLKDFITASQVNNQLKNLSYNLNHKKGMINNYVYNSVILWQNCKSEQSKKSLNIAQDLANKYGYFRIKRIIGELRMELH